MLVERLLPSQLTAGHRQTWESLCGLRIGLDSPFLAIGFYELLESIRGGVEIAVLSRDDQPVGFLPLERRATVAYPAGTRVSEIHGVITADDLAWDPPGVLQSLGLATWHYGCVPLGQEALEAYHLCRRSYPVIRLTGGLEAYEADRRGTGSQYVQQVRRKARKLAREVGPLQFVWHTADEAAFKQLADWKSNQYRRTGILDLLGIDWVGQFCRRAQLADQEDFCGVLSTLCAGRRLVAAHLGLRSRGVLCWWLPAYDPRLAPYSPGSILTLQVIEAAAERGLRRIDLGPGEERYKQSLANGAFEVAEGCVALRAWQRGIHQSWVNMRDWAQSTPWCAAPLRLFRSVRNHLMRCQESLPRR